MGRIISFVILDILKNKIVLFYALLLAALSWTIFALEDNTAKGVLSMLNVLLLIIPLVSIIFSTIYTYNSSEYIDLLVSQPVKRSMVWLGLYIGLISALSIAFFIGAGIPILIFAPGNISYMLALVGILITIVFISIALLSSVSTRDKAKGIGTSILIWLFFSMLFDGIVLFLLFQFAEYPIEHAMVAITFLSPIDIARILLLMQLDISALLGYTGAIFREFFGTQLGILIAMLAMLLWAVIPFLISLQKFNKKDL
ncbi:MAG: ABC transporter permease subunit [Bacteroidia bacterium]|nr:ABC transporter permease subunit [Bacteroidia bacterium]